MEKQSTRILLIDDEPDMAQVVSMRLKESGYQVTVTENGEEGLRSLFLWPPQLVLVDLLMPGIDGLEVCRRIRANHRFSQIPIIVLTAVAGLDLAKRVIRAGADGYLLKPYESRRLIATIETALQLSATGSRGEHPIPRGTPARPFHTGATARCPQEIEAEVMAGAGRRISHEIRTTLTAIRESIDLLKENKTTTEEQKKLIDIAERNIKRLSQFLKELLAHTEESTAPPAPLSSQIL